MTDTSLIELVEEYGDLMQSHGTTPFREYDEEAKDVLAKIRQRLAADALKIRALEDENERLRGQLAGLERDKQRLDWLADPENMLGSVGLPRECVEPNIHSMREAIDMAMTMDAAIAGAGRGHVPE